MTAAEAWRLLARAAELKAAGSCAAELEGVDEALAAFERANEPEAATCLAFAAATPEERAEEAESIEVLRAIRQVMFDEGERVVVEADLVGGGRVWLTESDVGGEKRFGWRLQRGRPPAPAPAPAGDVEACECSEPKCPCQRPLYFGPAPEAPPQCTGAAAGRCPRCRQPLCADCIDYHECKR